ncbi:uncharacterized protein GIQ15_00630 [Arthroderma uncinatum]|uniref:uncharacterized protein n=1 Tax=Arthroderma uncinatum TaxID=74035 RepID=UPI00144AB4FA|nr:uncharacterized protein GIQ15_00630 [Arthroderma uncinatum]KAF3491113.1 hypothetical protein GIQ15_00630 [Arthroderma uncinatum]
MADSYKIGIEIEILLTPNSHAPLSVEAFAQTLVSKYHEFPSRIHSIHCDLDLLPYDGPNSLSEWSIVEDCSLDTDNSQQSAFELTSPVMEYSRPTWKTSEAAWTLEDLKRISRAIIYFESSIELVVPEHRRGSIWGKNNRSDNYQLEGLSDVQAYSRVDACTTNEELVQLMNCGSNRNYGWNFTGLLDGDNFTIEFRRGPGLTREIDAFRWVEFVVRFVNSARKTGNQGPLTTYRRDVSGLRNFLSAHATPGGYAELVDPFFAGKTVFLEPRKVGQLTAIQTAKVMAKNAEKDRRNLIWKKWMGA